MGPLLRVEHVTICYNGIPVIHDVSFDLQEGEILGIVGESGSGKSTIIKAVMGLLGSAGMVTRGDIYYKGQNVVDMPQEKLRRLLGPEIGMVFQDCKAALCPIRTVGDQIFESMSEHGRISREESNRRAADIMEKIGLTDTKRVLESYPFELSGGMNQRVGICMAMMLYPSLLLADEPTSALDVTVQKQVVEELKLMRDEYKTAMIVVTHNIGVVGVLADQVLVLQNGRVMDYGSTDYVLHHSENAYTKKLIDSVLHLSRRNTETGKEAGTGTAGGKSYV